MTKIIRVSGCHECQYCVVLNKEAFSNYTYCNKGESFDNVESYENKTLPGNCPLEDEIFGGYVDRTIDDRDAKAEIASHD